MKVIFLDVDGVLNCQSSKSRCGAFIGIDGDKVKRLRKIVEATDARIVLCSSWKTRWEKRYKEDQSEAANYLDRKLKRERLYILDKTTEANASYRGEGIIRWIGEHNVDTFIILDDDDFDYEECGISSRHIKTRFYDNYGGIQDRHVELAIALLNTEQNN